MNVAELFKAMGNSVDRVHLLLADGGPHPSSLGTYTFDEDWFSDGNAWAILDTKNGIPERYHSYKVTAFYLYEGADGGTVIDIGISEHEEEERCAGVELDEFNGNMKFIVDIAVHVPKQMITKPLWDYTVRELMALYKELHLKEE